MNTGFETGKGRRSGWKTLINNQGIQWQGLEQLSWAQAMKACPQDPEYHAEGDVWTHTRMVVEALKSLPEFLACSPEIQECLLYAALLHDVAKPACTRTENGRIVSPGHARLGEKMARELLWDMEPGFRETVCALVRLHGLPLWGLEKQNPVRAAVLASWRIPNQQLCILTQADIMGRICASSEDLMYRLDLYRELCQENECYNQERAFYNDFSRHRYFWSDENYPVELFDDTRFEIIVLCGLPGSGKDFYAKNHFSTWPVVSLDAIRQEHGIAADDRNGQGKVAQIAYEQAKVYARAGQSFVWNSTNLSADLRARLIRTLGVYKPHFRIIYLETSFEKILSRRSTEIKLDRMERMLQRLDIPVKGEGHSLVWVREG
jgi:predicted kinase